MWQRQEVQEVLPSLRATPAVPAGLTRRRAARILAQSTAPQICSASQRLRISRPTPLQEGIAQATLTVQTLPADTLLFLLGSRYCETDRLADEAWRLFGTTPPGWARVQAICDFVHAHITFAYEHSRATRTAAEAYAEQRGVCRDYAHLALAFCRCLNIPARYCLNGEALGADGCEPSGGHAPHHEWGHAARRCGRVA